jgi:TonB-dependent SusC/RagA subfamily outer membrane receptor
MKTRIFSIIILMVFSVVLSYGQSKKVQISGTVRDTDQKPVSGAMIVIDGNNSGITTDLKGRYKLKIPADAKSIRVVTQTGESAESELVGQREVDFSLPVSLKPAGEVKSDEDDVNIGYGKVNKKNLTTNVSKVDSKNDKYVYKNIYEMLRGKPGVQVNGNRVIIQGASSLMSGTDPLYVVDGVIVNSIDDIPPETVKSIEILKGSSAAIYGSRGANGVILITLKTGND